MSSFNDTRHVIDGQTGGGTDDTTAYNDVLANGSTLTFTSINGDQKQVSVAGGTTGSVQAFNGATLDTSTNEVTFSSTTGASADEVVLDLDPMLTSLEGTVGGHTTDISNIINRVGGTNLNNAISALENNTGTSHLKGLVDGHTSAITALQTATPSVDAITIDIDISAGTDPNYTIQGIQRMPIELLLGHKYIFNYPSLHPLKLSTTEDGTHNGGVEYTGGRTDTITTPAAAVGVYWQFELITQSSTLLYYYCSLHSGMGGHLIRSNGFHNIKRNGFSYDTSVNPPKIIIERENGSSNYTQELNLSDSFVSAQKDGDNIKLTKISGAQTTVGPFSGGGTAASSTTNYPTSAMTSNVLPSPLVAVGSTEYNLFTDKLFGSDNLGNIGTFGGSNWDIQQWAYDVSDGNVIVTTHDGANTRFVKITLDGNLVLDIGGTGNRGKYILASEIVYTSAADLIADYNTAGSSASSTGYGFNKHALFDLAVNESKAFHAFDGVSTSEWVSYSNTYKPTTTVIHFSAYIDKTVEYAQDDLNQHYAFLQPQFMCENPRVQATSSNCNFESQKGSYTTNPGGINFWHAGTTNLALFRVVADADGTMSIKYGNLWTGNSVGLEHTSGGSTTTYSTGAVETTQSLTVLKGDIIEIVETLGVIALYSISFTRSTEVGDYIDGFRTVPTSIPISAGGWATSTSGNTYDLDVSNSTASIKRYYLSNSGVSQGANLGISFSTSGTTITLDVNDSTGGTDRPSYYINGGTTVSSGTGTVSANDVIELWGYGGSPPVDMLLAEITVPSELVPATKLASTTDAGEYIKLDLGSAIEAETLTLKSIAVYKEPRINLTAYSQCGYRAFTSSTSQYSSTPVYELFNSLTTPHTDYWVSDINKYDASTGNYSASANLGTDFPSGGTTVDGEYVAITLPDKRKLLGYKLTKPDGTSDNNSPKEFKLYARENSTSAWVLLNSETLTTAIGEYVSGDVNTGGTNFFPSTTPTTAYQTYALVVETIFTSGSSYSVHLSEFQLFCQPSEIENFKLYGSVNNSTWTQIHHQSSSANITSSGSNFTITNPGSYQYYGLVVTKTTGYHNVSLAEMKLGVTESVNLSEYYKLADWKTLIAGCADFAAFKTAVAAL